MCPERSLRTNWTINASSYSNGLKTASAKLDDYRAQESVTVEKNLLMANIVELTGKIGDGLDNLSSEERRDVLRLIVDQITIDHDNRVSITLGIPAEDLVSIEQEASRRK